MMLSMRRPSLLAEILYVLREGLRDLWNKLRRKP